jgi:uncharacterized protein (TIGR03435 family)
MNTWLGNSRIRTSLVFAVLTILFGITASRLQAQNTNFGGNRFFRTTITMHDEPLMAEVIFNDSDGNTIVQGAPLIDVITRAYGLRSYQVVDGPDWIHTSRLYDIEAVPPPAFVESNEALMLQALLSDRFGFEATATTRGMPFLVLELRGVGVDLEAAADTARGFKFRTFPVETGGMKLAASFTLDDLALILAGEYSQPVINLTGLTGRYMFELNVNPVFSSNLMITPYLMTKALLEQAGLSVEPKTILVDVLAIAKINHPELDVN